jgi:hypothetical protein
MRYPAGSWTAGALNTSGTKPIKRADSTWFEPLIGAEIAYAEITDDGIGAASEFQTADTITWPFWSSSRAPPFWRPGRSESRAQYMQTDRQDQSGQVINNASVDEIREAQQILNEKGYRAGKPDGKMGRQTTMALKRFQQSRDWNPLASSMTRRPRRSAFPIWLGRHLLPTASVEVAIRMPNEHASRWISSCLLRSLIEDE